MSKRKIEERRIKIPFNFAPKELIYLCNGYLTAPFPTVVVRCRYDIESKLSEIVKDKEKVKAILEIINEEFPRIMVDYRLKAEIDYTNAPEWEKILHEYKTKQLQEFNHKEM